MNQFILLEIASLLKMNPISTKNESIPKTNHSQDRFPQVHSDRYIAQVSKLIAGDSSFSDSENTLNFKFNN